MILPNINMYLQTSMFISKLDYYCLISATILHV